MKKYLVILMLFLIVGCSSVKQPIVSDTIYLNKTEFVERQVFDSIYVDRWHTIDKKGDTIFLKDSIYQYKYMFKHDTCYKTDTCYRSIEKTVLTNELTKWQKTEIVLFWVILVSFLSVIGYFVYKKVKK